MKIEVLSVETSMPGQLIFNTERYADNKPSKVVVCVEEGRAVAEQDEFNPVKQYYKSKYLHLGI